jgi:hypothetical protein
MTNTSTQRVSDRLQARLNTATCKAERASILGLLVTARRSEALADKAEAMSLTRAAITDDLQSVGDGQEDEAADRAEAAAEERAARRTRNPSRIIAPR